MNERIDIYMYIRVKHRGGEYICISVEMKAGEKSLRLDANRMFIIFFFSTRQLSSDVSFLVFFKITKHGGKFSSINVINELRSSELTFCYSCL